jgi:polyhydroxybutyrate depolymerase
LFRRLSARRDRRTIDVAGRTRTYYLHVPSSLPNKEPRPLVLVLHGGFLDGVDMRWLTRFDRLADREGLLVAYPNGVGLHWNDGREPSTSKAHQEQIDDVGFMSALIDAIGAEHPVDVKRVFATGLSNGAILSHYLAARLSGRIAAIAPVVGGIAERFAPEFRPTEPVSVFVIQGTADPLVPFGGGYVMPGQRGRVLPTTNTLELWVQSNGCAQEATVTDFPDRDPTDGCRVKSSRWPGGRNGSEVLFYQVEGGGHTWPGGPQYLPERVVGKVCRDFDATETMWQFFQGHARP